MFSGDVWDSDYLVVFSMFISCILPFVLAGFCKGMLKNNIYYPLLAFILGVAGEIIIVPWKLYPKWEDDSTCGFAFIWSHFELGGMIDTHVLFTEIVITGIICFVCYKEIKSSQNRYK